MPGLKLIAELGGDGRGFEKMMDGASHEVGHLGDHLAELFTIGAITEFTKSTIEWASSLEDVADGLSVNVEWLEKMTNGAKNAGGSLESLQKFLGDINKSRGDSVAGGADGAKKTAAFGRLGISETEISSLNTEKFFKKLMDRFKEGIDAQGLNDLREVGGKSARALAAAFANQFRSDAPIASKEAVSYMHGLGDQWTEFVTLMKAGLAELIYAAGKFAEKAGWKVDIAAIAAVLGALSAGSTPKEAGKIANDVASDYAKSEIKKEKSKADELAAAQSRANASPDFDKPIEYADKQKTIKPEKSDALEGAGRSFGRVGGAVNAIANLQLEQAKKAVAEQQETNRILREIAINYNKQGITMTIPPIR